MPGDALALPGGTADAFAAFTGTAVLASLRRALPHVPSTGFHLLRPPADNAMVHVLPLGQVARIGAGPSHRDRLARELALAVWLADRGVPVARPAPSPALPQLAVIDGRPVTWWSYLPSTTPGSPADLGALLRALHDQPEPWPDLPRLDPWARVAHQIEAASAALQAADVNRLGEHWALLQGEWDRSGLADAEPVVVHGDAYTGNTLMVDGRAVLLDFEDAALGPREWDLAAVAGSFRLGWTSPAAFAAFRSAYGAMIPSLGELDLLSRIILFRRCCWLASRTGREPALVPAARQRVSTLHLAPEDRGWTRGGP